MSMQITQTTVMDENRSVTDESGNRKWTRVTLRQYDGGAEGTFYILTQRVTGYDDDSLPTREDFVFTSGKEATIRAVNIWNSVVMEKDYAPDAPADDEGDFPF